MNRRSFCRNTLYTAALAHINTLPIWAHDDVVRLTILHTNDVHSRIDPFPQDGSRNAGQGGAARRAKLINRVRAMEDNVLLFDCGDIFQGTPYFNMFLGELEMKLMTSMGYDAGTMGNHDFDAGIDNFRTQMQHCDFPFIVSNYDFSDTVLEQHILKNKIWEIEGVKIGVYGLGIAFEGLVPDNLKGNTQYLDPIAIAREQETYLKNEMGCDYVLCLSHLGYKYREERVSDIVIAAETSHTDLILGGHTHSFLHQPEVVKNKLNDPVFINQAGWAGIMLGRVDLIFEKGAKNKRMQSQNLMIG